MRSLGIFATAVVALAGGTLLGVPVAIAKPTTVSDAEVFRGNLLPLVLRIEKGDSDAAREIQRLVTRVGACGGERRKDLDREVAIALVWLAQVELESKLPETRKLAREHVRRARKCDPELHAIPSMASSVRQLVEAAREVNRNDGRPIRMAALSRRIEVEDAAAVGKSGCIAHTDRSDVLRVAVSNGGQRPFILDRLIIEIKHSSEPPCPILAALPEALLARLPEGFVTINAHVSLDASHARAATDAEPREFEPDDAAYYDVALELNDPGSYEIKATVELTDLKTLNRQNKLTTEAIRYRREIPDGLTHLARAAQEQVIALFGAGALLRISALLRAVPAKVPIEIYLASTQAARFLRRAEAIGNRRYRVCANSIATEPLLLPDQCEGNIVREIEVHFVQDRDWPRNELIIVDQATLLERDAMTSTFLTDKGAAAGALASLRQLAEANPPPIDGQPTPLKIDAGANDPDAPRLRGFLLAAQQYLALAPSPPPHSIVVMADRFDLTAIMDPLLRDGLRFNPVHKSGARPSSIGTMLIFDPTYPTGFARRAELWSKHGVVPPSEEQILRASYAPSGFRVLGGRNLTEASELLNQCQRALTGGDLAEARAKCEAADSLAPEHPLAQIYAANVAHLSGEDLDAVSKSVQAWRLAPGLPFAPLQLALAALDQGAPGVAELWAQRYLVNRGIQLYDMGYFDAAAWAFAKALEIKGEDYEVARYNLAVIRRRSGSPLPREAARVLETLQQCTRLLSGNISVERTDQQCFSTLREMKLQVVLAAYLIATLRNLISQRRTGEAREILLRQLDQLESIRGFPEMREIDALALALAFPTAIQFAEHARRRRKSGGLVDDALLNTGELVAKLQDDRLALTWLAAEWAHRYLAADQGEMARAQFDYALGLLPQGDANTESVRALKAEIEADRERTGGDSRTAAVSIELLQKCLRRAANAENGGAAVLSELMRKEAEEHRTTYYSVRTLVRALPKYFEQAQLGDCAEEARRANGLTEATLGISYSLGDKTELLASLESLCAHIDLARLCVVHTRLLRAEARARETDPEGEGARKNDFAEARKALAELSSTAYAVFRPKLALEYVLSLLSSNAYDEAQTILAMVRSEIYDVSEYALEFHVVVLLIEARLAVRKNDISTALARVAAARARADRTKHKYIWIQSLQDIAGALAAHGESQQAETLLKEALSWTNPVSDTLTIAGLLLSRARLLRDTGKIAEARALLNQVQTSIEEERGLEAYFLRLSVAELFRSLTE